MRQIGRQRLTAFVMTVLLVVTATSPALAGGRWAPTVDQEDGDIAVIGSAATGESPTLPEYTATTAPEQNAPNSPGKAAADPVGIKSPSAILIEARSGRVLYEKNAHERRNPASVTKIMTLIVAFDALAQGKVKLDDKVTISEEAARQVGTIIFADAGETFSFGELLKSVAVGSANDAAVAVGEHVSGSVEAFVQAMNAKARELGMRDTQFQNPTGLSADGHFTSAYDIALMSQYAAINYPELMKLTAIYGADLEVPWRKNGPTFRLWNNNKLLTWYTGADGLKTGWTEAAGYCLAATAVRGDVRMISVVMGAESWKLRNVEAAKLLDYGFGNYTSVVLAAKAQPVGTVAVTRGRAQMVTAIPRSGFAVSVPKGTQAKVKSEIALKKRVEAPVEAGQVIGEMIATLDGKEIGRMPLVAAGAVPRANLGQTIGQHFRALFRIR